MARPFVVQDEGVATEAFVLPAGTVTFLLTDVEGSSRLWEERPDEMPAAVTRHYAILDEAIARHGGVRPVEQGEGDSAVGAFARAAEAVRAAVDAQRLLTAEMPWFRVRMAVHTGEAQLRDEGNYVGRTIIRCARLRTCAHGGQIVLSGTAAALLADGCQPARLTDLGTVRLRDLSRPEHVWQVVADGLPASFPPLRSLDAAPHSLPVPRTSFIGRERELAVVVQLVRDERVVTLTGSGGCGKTRLALHAAAEMVDAHPGGTWWVDLAPVTTPEAVVDQVACAVGTAAAPGADSTAALVGHLRDRGATLLVIDNAEHLVGAVAEVVDTLVAECVDVRLLVTSREPLGVEGELVWRVPSLSVPRDDEPATVEQLDAYESARLFLDRARRVRPNLVVDDESAALVASICARLDGIPLAVELAAARVRSVPLDALARGLDQAFRLLAGGSRTAMPRQQTLLASIAWSVDLLDDAERAVLRRLAVFQGGFELDAAEAVAADGETVTSYAVLDVIGRLVDKSLVLLDDRDGQYRLLQTIRQFALDRMRDAGELVDVRQRHAAWFAAWCESLGRGEHDFDLGPDNPVLPDVFAALEWAYDNAPGHAYRISRGLAGVRSLLGRYADYDRQYAWLARPDERDDPAGWAAGVAGLSHMAMVLGRVDYFELAARAEACLALDDVASRCLLRSASATVVCLSGDPTELAQLAADAEAVGDEHAARICHMTLATGNLNAGELDAVDAAVDAVRRMVARRRLPFAHHTAPVLVGVAACTAAWRGDVAGGRRLIDALGRPDASISLASNAYAAMAVYAAGDLAAIERLEQWQSPAEEAMRAHIRLTNEAHNLDGPALNVHWVRALIEQRWNEALAMLRVAYDRCPTSPALRSYILVPLATRLLAAGARDELMAILGPFDEDLVRIGPVPLPSANRHYVRALVARADGDLDTAWVETHAALEIAVSTGHRLRAIDHLHLLAVLSHQRGRATTAARLLGAVRAERDRIGYAVCELPDSDDVALAEGMLRESEAVAWSEGAGLAFTDAVDYARRCRGERSRASHGWDSLTPTERRVAALVAEGRTNDDVAREAFMSVATVKTHLTHIFAKTGVATRAALAAKFPRS